jgi:hypothetical protein
LPPGEPGAKIRDDANGFEVILDNRPGELVTGWAVGRAGVNIRPCGIHREGKCRSGVLVDDARLHLPQRA